MYNVKYKKNNLITIFGLIPWILWKVSTTWFYLGKGAHYKQNAENNRWLDLG